MLELPLVAMAAAQWLMTMSVEARDCMYPTGALTDFYFVLT